MTRIVVGMSGGVDSSLAAVLMKEQGHEVVGVTMKLWPCAEVDGGFTREDACCSPTETVDARSVALKAGVSHYVVDLEDEFAAGVVDGFVAAYGRGETPNPCVRCNETIKFGSLWDYSRDVGAAGVATGHYARVVIQDGRHCLAVAKDTAKDQTYFLFSLSQEQLASAHFPVGGMSKTEVRDQARSRGLITADKHESQDICFIGRGGVEGFLRQRLPAAFVPGPIRHQDGRLLGEHRGLAAFTLGQRKGLGVAWSEPLYVVGIDREANAVVLGPQSALLVGRLTLKECTWHLGAPGPAGLHALVRTRHRGQPVRAVITAGPEPAGATVHFAQDQLRPNAGQACVAYDPAMDLCLGGGWIT